MKRTVDKDTMGYQQVEIAAYQEMLRQAQQTYNVHWAAMVSAIMVSLVGVGLVLVGKPIEGSASAVVGTGSGALFSHVTRHASKETERKLSRLVKEVKALR